MIWVLVGWGIITILVCIRLVLIQDDAKVLSWQLTSEKERTKNWRSPMECNALASQIRAEEVSKVGPLAEAMAQNRLAEWRATEIDGIREMERASALNNAKTKLVEWKLEQEPAIRADAVLRSQSVIKGKITEHLVPFFPQFNYNSKDARFSGSPIDLIVYNGLSEGSLKEIIFIEVKTGESQLTTRERQVRDCIKAGNLRWEELRV